MLVLSRKLGEKIRVTLPDGSKIGIIVVDIDRGKIRLGVEAVQAVVIDREEIALQKDAERKNGQK